MLGELAISISSVRPSPSWYRGTGQLLSWLAQAGSLSSEGSLAAVLVLVSTMIYTIQQLVTNIWAGR
jgi:hypothetical protein